MVKLTKQEAKKALEALNRMFDALPKSKKMEFVGELNDVSLVLERVQREAK